MCLYIFLLSKFYFQQIQEHKNSTLGRNINQKKTTKIKTKSL